jgi:hypothetical protein
MSHPRASYEITNQISSRILDTESRTCLNLIFNLIYFQKLKRACASRRCWISISFILFLASILLLSSPVTLRILPFASDASSNRRSNSATRINFVLLMRWGLSAWRTSREEFERQLLSSGQTVPVYLVSTKRNLCCEQYLIPTQLHQSTLH